MTECIFCKIKQIEEDMLWQSDNFFVKVGVGILAPGHVMLISKKHMSCFAELPAELEEEFLQAKDRVFNTVKSGFSEPVVYEHGVYSQSVKHAHLHFLPKKGRLYSLEDFGEKIFSSLESEPAKDFFAVRKVFKEDGSYMYFEENGRGKIFRTKGLPESKFTFRKEFARLTGIKGLESWQNMTEKEKLRNSKWVKETKERLQFG